MQKFYITFKDGHLEDYYVDPNKTILVLEGKTSYLAMLDYFGQGFTDKFQSVCDYQSYEKYYKGRSDIKVYLSHELEKERKEKHEV